MAIQILILLVCSILSLHLSADSDLERQNLANLVEELNFLISRTEQYKRVPKTDQRVHFHYETLARDLALIRNGINDHVSDSLQAGRKLEPLQGNYHD